MLLESFTVDEPIFLLADFLPDAEGGGAVIVESFLRDVQLNRLVWVTTRAPGKTLPMRVIHLSRGSEGRTGRSSLFLDSTVCSAPLAREVEELVSAYRPRGIWAIAHGPIVPIISRLRKNISVPIHLSVHDDPPFGVAWRSKRYLMLVPLLACHFRRCIGNATSIDVVSEGMQRRYLTEYGVHTSILHRALEPSSIMPGEFSGRNTEIEVGVLGNVYAYSQLKVFAQALILAGELLKVKCRLVVIGQSAGNRIKIDLGSRLAIEVLGHVVEEEAVDRLRQCYCLYLNYPFGFRDRVLRETSFPTKLSTYVQAGRPLLVHAPNGTTLDDLNSYTSCVAAWTSMQVSQGAGVIADAWSRSEWRQPTAQAMSDIGNKYYNRNRHFVTLKNALDGLARIPPTESETDH